MRTSGLICICVLLLCGDAPLTARNTVLCASKALLLPQTDVQIEHREIAAYFAPVFYQALGDKPRSDYFTNFDFDGDWRGNNNWVNAEDSRFPVKAYVYYSVSETRSHIFIHYAVFHPRDYKGGERKGVILSELMRQGTKRGGKYDPTGLAAEATLAHENDMEGCLVVVAKGGSDLKRGRVAFVETLHHNVFSKYVPAGSGVKGFETITMDGPQVLLYIEPKGHGIEAHSGSEKQIGNKRLLIYRFTGKAEEPGENQEGPIGYDLVPLQSTLWSRARQKDGLNDTFGAAHDYGVLSINIMQANGRAAQLKFNVGKLGSAFVGNVGGVNMARPPWAWSDRNSRDEPLGQWFFDPAKTVKRDFNLGESFSTVYVRLPFWAER